MSKFSQLFKRITNRPAQRERGASASVFAGSNLVATLGVVILLLAAVYLVQLNRSATKSFAVHSLVQQHEQLLEERRALELRQAELTALSNLEQSPVISRMVASTDIEYLAPATSDVAKR